MKENILVPTKQQYYDLVRAKTTIHLYDELSIWPNWAPNERHAVTSNEYWRLNELLDIIKPQDKGFFANPLTLDMAFEQNTPNGKEFAKLDKKELAYHHMRPTNDNNDMELSRYAAWTLIKEIGKTMPTEFVEAYFIRPNASLFDLYHMSEQTGRVPLREQVAKLNDTLDGIFYSLGATHQHFAKFNHEKIEWLFNNKTKKEIIKQRALFPNVQKPKAGTLANPAHTQMYDYMNKRLLNAYINAAKSIIEKWDANPQNHNYFALRDMTYYALHNIVADFWCNGETSPLANLNQFGIKSVEKCLNENRLAFAKKYINEKIR
ncbi:MAG: hypothetical protein J5620_04155 [Alphaproteobacteria bacterium]|nr:hypothetical protein [Alphaproteobacteria bacterium]